MIDLSLVADIKDHVSGKSVLGVFFEGALLDGQLFNLAVNLIFTLGSHRKNLFIRIQNEIYSITYHGGVFGVYIFGKQGLDQLLP